MRDISSTVEFPQSSPPTFVSQLVRSFKQADSLDHVRAHPPFSAMPPSKPLWLNRAPSSVDILSALFAASASRNSLPSSRPSAIVPSSGLLAPFLPPSLSFLCRSRKQSIRPLAPLHSSSPWTRRSSSCRGIIFLSFYFLRLLCLSLRSYPIIFNDATQCFGSNQRSRRLRSPYPLQTETELWRALGQRLGPAWYRKRKETSNIWLN